MIRKGEEWGSAATEPPDLEVCGSDSDLATALTAAGVPGPPGHGPLVRFRPSGGSDLALALGLPAAGTEAASTAVPIDVLRLSDGRLAVNGVVAGVPPGRLEAWHRRRPVDVTVDGRLWGRLAATSVVVLTGQFLHGLDVSPRGHPGDGRAEIQIFGLPPMPRRPMRARLGTGSHVPHPAITTGRGDRFGLRFWTPVPVEIDGRPAGSASTVDVDLVAAAYRLLV